ASVTGWFCGSSSARVKRLRPTTSSELVTSAVRAPAGWAPGVAPAARPLAVGAATWAARVAGGTVGAWVGVAAGALHAAARRPRAVAPRPPRKRRRVVCIGGSIPAPAGHGQNFAARFSDDGTRRRGAPG